MHIEYKKIKRFGDEENDGILMGKVFVQEKIDGANVSIWIEEGELCCGSRTRQLNEGFNGFVDYLKANDGIKGLLAKHPTVRLFGEWLVRHTIAYDETAYKAFYLFDVLDGEQFWTTDRVDAVADEFGLKKAIIFDVLQDPNPDDLQKYVGKTMLGQKGEGVVLKNPDFINKFGDRVYAKIVTQEFKEDNAIVFGGNNKHSETYIEMKMVNECMTLARIQKIMNKLQPLYDRRLGREQTARIIQTAYHDMFVEELWEFVKKNPKVDFSHLAKLSQRKAAKIYHDILDDRISVAYKQPE